MIMKLHNKKGSTFDGTAQVWGRNGCQKPLEIAKSLRFRSYVFVERCANETATSGFKCANCVQPWR
jgi:hypothetical protein